MPDGDGKGARVTGFFFFLLGAGIILDSRAAGVGTVVALSGAAVMSWGFLQAGRHRRSGLTRASSETS